MCVTSLPSSRRIRGRKRWRLRFAKRSSTRAGALALAFGAAAVVAAVVGSTIVLAIAVAAAAALAVYLIVVERRRHEAAELELTSEAHFLESLVDSMAAVAGADDVLAETCAQAEQLFAARARLLGAGDRPRKAPAESAVIPIK